MSSHGEEEPVREKTFGERLGGELISAVVNSWLPALLAAICGGVWFVIISLQEIQATITVLRAEIAASDSRHTLLLGPLTERIARTEIEMRDVQLGLIDARLRIERIQNGKPDVK